MEYDYKQLFFITLCVFFSVVRCFQSDVEYDGILSLKLQHALDDLPDPEFTDRGAINIQSIRTGSAALQQISLPVPDRKKLKALANNDGMYRLRVAIRTMDGKDISFLTFVKACSLVESSLSDAITVSLDHTGMPVAVSLTASPESCDGHFVSDDSLRQFNTAVYIKHMEQGPVPDTASYIQKLEREKEARERGETKDNRSFLAKYERLAQTYAMDGEVSYQRVPERLIVLWMYIVPVVIFVLLSGAANPEGAAGGGGGGR